jgi:hypothetical protein
MALLEKHCQGKHTTTYGRSAERDSPWAACSSPATPASPWLAPLSSCPPPVIASFRPPAMAGVRERKREGGCRDAGGRVVVFIEIQREGSPSPHIQWARISLGQ